MRNCGIKIFSADIIHITNLSIVSCQKFNDSQEFPAGKWNSKLKGDCMDVVVTGETNYWEKYYA